VSALRWWLRAVGALYVLLFVAAALLRIPVRAEGPAGVLERAAAGDPTARFVVDTWVTLGLELGAVGAALLVASFRVARASALVTVVIYMELAGIVADIYKVARGQTSPAPFVWVAIHAVIIVTGLRLLRSGREAFESSPRPAGAVGSPSGPSPA
jgi:hypothetical protein